MQYILHKCDAGLTRIWCLQNNYFYNCYYFIYLHILLEHNSYFALPLLSNILRLLLIIQCIFWLFHKVSADSQAEINLFLILLRFGSLLTLSLHSWLTHCNALRYLRLRDDIFLYGIKKMLHLKTFVSIMYAYQLSFIAWLIDKRSCVRTSHS